MVISANGRNIALLAIAQAIFMTTVNMNIIVTSLVGVVIAPEPWLATLPLSMLFIASMLTTLPASLIMGRFGRKAIFICAAVIGVVACLLLAQATIIESFSLFMAASIMLGVTHGVAQFYRYAAADNADKANKARALSLVLAGGILAAFIGPNLARMTFLAIPDHIYAGCFYAAAGVQAVALVTLPFLRIKTDMASDVAVPPVPIGTIFRQPFFIAGLISASIGYGMMTLVMTATPLQIVNTEQFGNDSNAIIIQWHVVAMLLPSLITGQLIRRFGVIPILWAGVLFYLAMVTVTLSGDSFWHYLITLILLGLGWNMLFVGGSSIVAQSCTPEQRPRVQGMADLTITFMMAMSSLAAATMHYLYGWQVMILMSIALIAIISISILIAMIRPTPDHMKI
jgi:MFS family permease